MTETKDGVTWNAAKNRLIGSVSTVRSRDVHRPAQVGEFPVFVEQSGAYRMFTYSKTLTAIAAPAL